MSADENYARACKLVEVLDEIDRYATPGRMQETIARELDAAEQRAALSTLAVYRNVFIVPRLAESLALASRDREDKYREGVARALFAIDIEITRILEAGRVTP